MLRIEVKGDCLVQLDMEGEVTEIAAELGASNETIWYRRNKFWSRGEA
jgi:hypothetical protein